MRKNYVLKSSQSAVLTLLLLLIVTFLITGSRLKAIKDPPVVIHGNLQTLIISSSKTPLESTLSSHVRFATANLDSYYIRLSERGPLLAQAPVTIATTGLNVVYLRLEEAPPEYFAVAPIPIVESLSLPERAYVGEEVKLKITLRNSGSEGGVFLKIYLNESLAVEKKLRLGEGESKTLEVPIILAPAGTLEICVETGGEALDAVTSKIRKTVSVEEHPGWQVVLLRKTFNATAGEAVHVPVKIVNPYSYPVTASVELAGKLRVLNHTLTAEIPAQTAKTLYAAVVFDKPGDYEFSITITFTRKGVKIASWSETCQAKVAPGIIPQLPAIPMPSLMQVIPIAATVLLVCFAAVIAKTRRKKYRHAPLIVSKLRGRGLKIEVAPQVYRRLKGKVYGYEILGEIGASRFVTLAAVKDGKFYALKVPIHAFSVITSAEKLEEVTVNEKTLRKLRREFEALKTLNHPNIVKAYELLPLPALVLEYCPYGDVGRFTTPISLKLALEIIIPVLDALAYAHSLGIVHRDVKPRNIMLGQGVVPKLGDFDAARLAWITGTSSTVIFTPGFGAPEQVRGWRGDRFSDVFSAAATLYWLVSGRYAYPSECYVGEIKFENVKPVNPGLPKIVWEPLRKALNVKREKRPTAEELRDSLAEAYYQLYGISP